MNTLRVWKITSRKLGLNVSDREQTSCLVVSSARDEKEVYAQLKTSQKWSEKGWWDGNLVVGIEYIGEIKESMVSPAGDAAREARLPLAIKEFPAKLPAPVLTSDL